MDQLEQLQETVQDLQARYRTAKDNQARTEAYLAKLHAKKGSLASELTALAAELETQQAAAEQALARYVADEINEEALTASRRAVADLEQRHQDAASLVDALTAEINKTKTALEEAQAQTHNLHRNCWRNIARLEAAMVRQASTDALQRAYLVAQCARTYGGALQHAQLC